MPTQCQLSRLVGTCIQKQSNVWDKTFENPSIAKKHRVQIELTEYKKLELIYAKRNMSR